jgi:hypothetical protein
MLPYVFVDIETYGRSQENWSFETADIYHQKTRALILSVEAQCNFSLGFGFLIPIQLLYGRSPDLFRAGLSLLGLARLKFTSRYLGFDLVMECICLQHHGGY